MFNVERI